MSLLGIKRDRPRYLQIAEVLLAEIQQQYEDGMLLPSEPMLAQRFGVNRHTVRHAVEELIAAGIVERRHGVGVVVLETAISYKIGRKSRFTEGVSSLGLLSGTVIVKKHRISAVGGVSRRLKMNDGDAIICLETLRLVEDVPFCIISHFLPLSGLEAVLEEYEEGSLHGFIREKCGIEVVRRDSIVSTALPIGDDAKYLKIGRYQPVLRVKTVNIDICDARPVEYALTRFRGDRAQLAIDFGQTQ